MPSSSRPYQSKLLRFVLKQWQQGLERQDQAWRQLQSTAVWGAQVAIFPIYAIMRAVKRASFTLGSGGHSSKFDPTAETMTVVKGKTTTAKDTVTDIDHSLTAILTHAQQILSSRQREKLMIAPKRSLIRQAKSLLAKLFRQSQKQRLDSLQSAGKSTAITKAQQSSESLATADKIHQKSGGLTLDRTVSINRRTIADLAQNGTTLASSVKTQKLVLVNLKNEIFDIFTPEQQTDLKHYIARVMHAYQQSRTQSNTTVPRRSKRLSVKTVLAISGVFITALPTEFRKAWSQIAPGPQPLSLPRVTTNNLQAEPQAHIFYPQSSSSSTVKARVRRLSSKTAGQTNARRRLTSNSPDAFEANVNDVNYLEHPLERLLRWIDRVLTWCEQRWQQWRRR